MKVAGIAIDPWKLAIFKRHLDEAGFSYTEHPGKTMTVLKVKTEFVATLQPVVEAAQLECKMTKRSGHED